MKTLAFLVAVSLAFPCMGEETPKPNMAVTFGNTIVSVYPDGRKGRLWLKADGTYTGTSRKNTPSSGTWVLKEGDLCLKQKRPILAPFSYCTPAPNAGIGSSWDAKAVTGEPIRITIHKGIVK